MDHLRIGWQLASSLYETKNHPEELLTSRFPVLPDFRRAIGRNIPFNG